MEWSEEMKGGWARRRSIEVALECSLSLQSKYMYKMQVLKKQYPLCYLIEPQVQTRNIQPYEFKQAGIPLNCGVDTAVLVGGATGGVSECRSTPDRCWLGSGSLQSLCPATFRTPARDTRRAAALAWPFCVPDPLPCTEDTSWT